jgi:hypothetical protein
MDIIQKMQDDSLEAWYTESNRNPRNESLILRLKSDIRENSTLLNDYALGTPIIAAHRARLKNKGLDQPDEIEKASQLEEEQIAA